MARSIVFVNDSGAAWSLTRFGGIVVPATGTYDVTAVISDDELVSAIQKGLGAEFDASHYLRIGGTDKTAAESREFMTPGQAGGCPILMANGAINDTQHGERGGGLLHTAAVAGVSNGFMSSADKTKLDGISPGASLTHDYQFGRSTQVPGGGTLQLVGPGDATAAVRMLRAGTITGASIQVDGVDAARSYDLHVYKNGASVATVNLPISTLGANSAALAVAVAIGDLIQAYLIRATGGGASTFANMQALVEVKF